MTDDRELALRFVRENAEQARRQAEVVPAFVVRAREAGATLREIAEAAGLSVEGVRKMIARELAPS